MEEVEEIQRKQLYRRKENIQIEKGVIKLKDMQTGDETFSDDTDKIIQI